MKKALALMTVVFATATASTFAYQGDKDHMTEEEKAEHMQQMEEKKIAYEEAIKNNDFDAYKNLHEEGKEKMKEHIREKSDTQGKKMEKSEQKYEEWTEEEREMKLQESFDEKVAYYNETGEVHMKEKKMRSGKYFRDHEKGIVKAALSNTSNEKIEQVVERIDMLTEKLDEIEDEKVLDMLLGIREVLIEKLSA